MHTAPCHAPAAEALLAQAARILGPEGLPAAPGYLLYPAAASSAGSISSPRPGACGTATKPSRGMSAG